MRIKRLSERTSVSSRLLRSCEDQGFLRQRREEGRIPARPREFWDPIKK
ncbi:hypothetical protein [Streptomyces sp. NPDC059224]